MSDPSDDTDVSYVEEEVEDEDRVVIEQNNIVATESKGTLEQLRRWGFDGEDATGIWRRYSELAGSICYRTSRKQSLLYVAALDYYKQNSKVINPHHLLKRMNLSENHVCKGLRLYNESSQSIYGRLDWEPIQYIYCVLEELGVKTDSNVIIFCRLMEFLESLKVDSQIKRSKPHYVAIGVICFHFTHAVYEDEDIEEENIPTVEQLTEKYGCSENTIMKIANDVETLIMRYAPTYIEE